MPLSSSPWRPAMTKTVGPSSLARSTRTGTCMGVRVCKCATSKLSCTLLPGKISCPSMVIFLCIVFLALDISFNIGDDFACDIGLGCFFDAFEARRRIHFQDQRAALRLQ